MILRESAQLLRDEAACLLRSHTVHGRWVITDRVDAEAKRVYDDMRRHAAALMVMAGEEPKR